MVFFFKISRGRTLKSSKHLEFEEVHFLVSIPVQNILPSRRLKKAPLSGAREALRMQTSLPAAGEVSCLAIYKHLPAQICTRCQDEAGAAEEDRGQGPGAEGQVWIPRINPKEAPRLPVNKGTTWEAQPKARKESPAK